MKSLRPIAWSLTTLAAWCVVTVASAATPRDPLPSWNDTESKRAILAYVDRVTRDGSTDLVPMAERIAVFDNDGTLWPENPVPFQVAFVRHELDRLIPQHPEWKNDPAVQGLLSGDAAALTRDNNQGLLRVLALTHAGMSVEEFDRRVKAWVAADRHPRFGCIYTRCVYQPMLELLTHLRSRGFQTWIVSGGGKDFMRVWSFETYGIAPEHVIGSYSKTQFTMRDGKPLLTKTLDTLFIDDREGKPAAIHQFIGRRPIAAFGNSDGDQAMLQYVTIDNPRTSFGLIVHHTDAVREYAYDANPSSSGKLVSALDEAPRRGWVVVDMRKDWATVFPRGQ